MAENENKPSAIAAGLKSPKSYERLRSAARAFSEEILECTPVGADQSAAIRKVREAVMTANAAIAIGEL